ncbi:MAG TPA: hypothetical protein VKU87_12240 [Thermomicrobiaceae bacterium]|nr:hypothetical protein [Thermomicrobiaceae bacterium]
MIDYDTLAEAIFREQARIEVVYRARHGSLKPPLTTTTPRRRLAGLLMALASRLAPVTVVTPTTEPGN